ncbi:class I SAM-dependent methyltransferase [Serratia proteamaculans]|uniref:class I SAM-dependent methyltransferase n=1 Tax=Serratia proteamaculans TaxID=28151 RepID=UPI002177A501|nr:methyltransferase domain-containing protein [Serratia proteamaculans]CAI1537885.1 Uncharacterized protein conserved in bacteria [Serratia proteamaculans]
MIDDFYRIFEEKHRGSVQEIKRRLSVYLPFITPLAKIYPSSKVVDIGCGRGEWLETLRDNAIPAMGVDLDDGMLERATQIGLNVQKMDCLAFIQKQEDSSLLAITGFHIAEHLPFEVLQSLIKESLRVLKPGGLLILETPNPENLSVGTCSFYMDPTHRHPLPPPLLEFIPDYYGFVRTKILRLQEKAELKNPEIPVSLIDVLKGVSPDYSLIAQKKAEEAVACELDPLFDNKEYGITLDGLSDRYEQRLNGQFNRMDEQFNRMDEQFNRMDEQFNQMDEQFNQMANVHCNQQVVKLDEVENKLERFQHQLEKSHQELLAIHAHNQSLQKQLIDVHTSHSWCVTYPLRWASCQIRAVRDEGIKARARKAGKKVLRRMFNTALGLFHEHPKLKSFVFSSARKLGVYRLLQSVFRRVLNSAPSHHTVPMANERHVVYQEHMTSRAIDMYEQLKNANNKKHGE